MESRETIAAIATGMGNAGIGIVRISGDAVSLYREHGRLWRSAVRV